MFVALVSCLLEWVRSRETSHSLLDFKSVLFLWKSSESGVLLVEFVKTAIIFY